jgi:hypothetical protein
MKNKNPHIIKYILTLFTVLISTCINAQKVKIDKQEIKLDEKTIGYIEGKKPSFKIYSLDKSYYIIAELKNVPNAESLTLPWIEIKNETTGKANEIEFKSRKFSAFNYDRSIIYELLDRNFMTAEGLSVEALNSFITGESTGISAKRLGIQNDVENANILADSYQLAIGDNGVIYSIKAQNPDPNDKIIGYIQMTSPSANGELKYEVGDLDNKLVATWFAKGGTYSGYDKLLNQELITYDNKVLKAAFDNRGNPTGYQMSKDITAMNIVRALVGNGYTLGSQYSKRENK